MKDTAHEIGKKLAYTLYISIILILFVVPVMILAILFRNNFIDGIAAAFAFVFTAATYVIVSKMVLQSLSKIKSEGDT